MDKTTGPKSGETSASQQQERKPKLPHERDESTATTPVEPKASIQQAHRDVSRGLVDTDRGAEADKVYHKQKT